MVTIVKRTRRSTHRAGLSILEFLGCLAALGGGLLLGSLYLGLNVKEMAYVVLEQAHVVDPRPKSTAEITTEGNATAAPAGSPEDASSTMTPDPIASNTTTTPPADATEIAPSTAAEPVNSESASTESESAPSDDGPTAGKLVESALPAPMAGLFAREDLITPEQRQALTLAYWESLGACMLDEEQHRVPAIDDEGNWQLFDYLTGRKDGHLKAAAAIAALDVRGVDDHVLAYSKKARAWHVDGAKLFGRAVDLLTDAPTAQLSGPFAQSWQSAATQHRMEARLLAEKQQAVRSYLDHAYEPVTAAPEAAAAQ